MYVVTNLIVTGSQTTDFFPLRHEKNPFNVGVYIAVPSSTTGNISLEYTGAQDFNNAIQKDVKVHEEVSSLSLGSVANSTFFVSLLLPCSALRFVLSSASDNLTINVIQAGDISA